MTTLERIDKIATEEAKVRLMAVHEELCDLPQGQQIDLNNTQLKVVYDHLYSACKDAIMNLLTEGKLNGS